MTTINESGFTGFQRFPDFGQELKRPFEVHESCYDCAAFYHGCSAWPAAEKFACAHYQRLPDVMPGTHGQKFPDEVFVPTDPQRSPARADHRPREPKPKPGGREQTNGLRRCECGEPLAKHKRYCEACRAARRQRTRTEYMRTYMQGRRGGPAQTQTDSYARPDGHQHPVLAQTRAEACPARVPPKNANFCTNIGN